MAFALFDQVIGNCAFDPQITTNWVWLKGYLIDNGLDYDLEDVIRNCAYDVYAQQ